MLLLGAKHRAVTGLEAGAREEVERTVRSPMISPPHSTIDATAAREFFDGLSYSQKRWFTLGLAEAKKPETRPAPREVVRMAALLSYVIAIGSSAIMPPLGDDALNRLFERLMALVRIGTSD